MLLLVQVKTVGAFRIFMILFGVCFYSVVREVLFQSTKTSCLRMRYMRRLLVVYVYVMYDQSFKSVR